MIKMIAMESGELIDSTRRVRWLVLGMLARLAVDHPSFCGAVGESYASDIGEEIFDENWGEKGPLMPDESEVVREVSQVLAQAYGNSEWEEDLARFRQTATGHEIAWLASNAFLMMMKNGMPPYSL